MKRWHPSAIRRAGSRARAKPAGGYRGGTAARRARRSIYERYPGLTRDGGPDGGPDRDDGRSPHGFRAGEADRLVEIG
jgi:hypothetical protein